MGGGGRRKEGGRERNVAIFCDLCLFLLFNSEVLYEDVSFPERELSALVASKVGSNTS